MPIALPLALVASAGIGAAGSIIGGSQAAGAANNAADLQQQRYEQTRADLTPYNQTGQNDFAAANRLMLGAPSQTEAQLQGQPGYQFTQTQGLKAVANSAAARGLGVSGAAQKGAATYATGLADTTYGNTINRLMSGATLGENAAAQTGAQGATLAGNAANALISGGQAAAAGTVGATTSLSNGLTGYGMYGGGSGAPASYYTANDPNITASPSISPYSTDLPPF